MSGIIVWDIETGAQSPDTIKSVLPPWSPDSIGSHPGEFNPATVKLGNTKDKDKIDAKIAEAAEKHAAAVQAYEQKLATGESTYWQEAMDKAALSAVIGCIVAIGYHGKKRLLHIVNSAIDERFIINEFWKTYASARQTRRQMVGFRIKPFDLPFIIQRSWILGLDVPPEVFTPTGYLDQTFVDLEERWKCGNRSFGLPGHGTLDAICRAMCIGCKPNDCTGADFAKLIATGNPEDFAKAQSYLDNDIDMTVALAERLGF